MTRKLRQLSLTAELVALVDRKEPDSGPEYGLVEMTDEEYEQAAHEFLRRKSDMPFWVFAYGSLIWRPDFEHIEHRTCRAFGWRQSFCLDIVRWRATPQQPGLMMCMDYGGSCHGVAFRLPDGNDREQMCCGSCAAKRATRRTCPRSAGSTCMTANKNSVRSPSGPRRAHRVTNINLPIVEQAQRLARAAGHLGTSAEYLHNTIVELEEFAIHDSYLWRLQKLVADEIRWMNG